MGCPTEVEINKNLVFSVCTHDPDTAILTDADDPPTYRIYEDETGTPILTGSMAKLDDGNTTGFYTKQLACTAANGFEADKVYTVYVVATVDSDTGGISYSFRARPPASGEGAYTGTLTVDDGDGTVLEGAIVNARRGGVLMASGTTGPLGTITDWVFGAFTYDLAVRLDGYQPATDTIAVTGNAWTKTTSLTAFDLTPSDEPDSTTAYWVVKDNDRATVGLGEATMYMRIRKPPTTDGYAWSEEQSTAVATDADGICQFPNTPKGSTVLVRLGTSAGDWKSVDIPSDAGATYAAGEIIGKIVASS